MKRTFIDGLALGVFITLLVLFSLAITFNLHIFGNNSDNYIQTILTSLAAIGAAYLALQGIQNQIQQNFEIEDKRRRNSLLAARASLPLTLSALVRISRSVLRAIMDGQSLSPKELVDSIEDPHVLASLTRCIEFADGETGERLSQIMRYIQLVRARFDQKYFIGIYLKNETSWNIVNHNRTSYIIDWTILIALCNCTFRFARGSEPTVQNSLELNDVINAINTSGVFLEEYPLLEQVIQERSASGRLERDFSKP
ncbi:MAG: hypothetical protein J0H60_18400 [Rhizobiales bacterium]|nr:hypothetical protein [Hyphomicrobiales bacterium]